MLRAVLVALVICHASGQHQNSYGPSDLAAKKNATDSKGGLWKPLPMAAVHGATMVFRWGLGSSAGVFVARYCRRRPGWVELHVQFQGVASVGAVSALVLAVGMVKEQLAHWHAVLGVVVMSLTAVQVAGGTFVHSQRLAKLGTEGVRGSAAELWAAFAHRSLGRCLLLAAMVNAWEGLRLLGGTKMLGPVLAAFMGVVGTVFVVAEVRLRTGAWDDARQAPELPQLMDGATTGPKATGLVPGAKQPVLWPGAPRAAAEAERAASAALAMTATPSGFGFAEQSLTRAVLTTLLDQRLVCLLAAAPHDRLPQHGTEVAAVLSALPAFTGARLPVAATSGAAVRRDDTVARVCATAARRPEGVDLSRWWRPSDRLVRLVSACRLLEQRAEAATTPCQPRGSSTPPDGDGEPPTPPWCAPSLGATSAADDPLSGAGLLDAAGHVGAPAELASALVTRSGAAVGVSPFFVVRGSVTVDASDGLGLLRSLQQGERWGRGPAGSRVVRASPGTAVVPFGAEAWAEFHRFGPAASGCLGRV